MSFGWTNLLKASGLVESNVEFGEPRDLLKGRRFSITGDLESMTRDHAIGLIKSFGGEYSDSVSKKTYALIVGNSPGKTKVLKASKSGSKIEGEQYLIDLLEEDISIESDN